MERKSTHRSADHPMFDGKANICFIPRKPPQLTKEQLTECDKVIEEHMQQTAPGMPTLSFWIRTLDRMKLILAYAAILLMLVIGLWIWQLVPCDQPTTLTWGHSHCGFFGGIPEWLLYLLQWKW